MIVIERAAERVAMRLGATCVAVERLEGGVSADVYALDVLRDGAAVRWVLRMEGAANGTPATAGATQRQYDLLGTLASAGVPVPTPVAVDLSQTVLPRPYLVMTFVPGTTSTDGDADCLCQMADVLAHIHTLDPGLCTGLPPREDPAIELLQYLPDRLKGVVVPTLPPAVPAVLHGDFWPGNVLWQDGVLQAVIDWEDAAIGDATSDLAQCRLELLWRYGAEAMAGFTTQYLQRRPVEPIALAVWELYVAASGVSGMHHWGLAPDEEGRMRTLADGFMDDAVRRLASR